MNITTAVITISDRSSQGLREDRSGPALLEKIKTLGWQNLFYEIIPDEIEQIRDKLAVLADKDEVNLILTSGGTGFAPRDVTPEATLQVVEKITPGLAEVMRFESLKITPHAMLSRAVAGIRKKTLIINLPGSPKAAIENLEFLAPVIPHAVELINEDPLSEENHNFKK